MSHHSVVLVAIALAAAACTAPPPGVSLEVTARSEAKGFAVTAVVRNAGREPVEVLTASEHGRGAYTEVSGATLRLKTTPPERPFFCDVCPMPYMEPVVLAPGEELRQDFRLPLDMGVEDEIRRLALVCRADAIGQLFGRGGGSDFATTDSRTVTRVEVWVDVRRVPGTAASAATEELGRLRTAAELPDRLTVREYAAVR